MYTSTGTMLVAALKDDDELVDLLLAVGRKYPQGEASALVHDAIERTSTSVLAGSYGDQRPTGLEFLKFELSRLLDE
jgi:hypothetical protein